MKQKNKLGGLSSQILGRLIIRKCFRFASILQGSAICNREMQYLEADAHCYRTGVDGIDWDSLLLVCSSLEEIDEHARERPSDEHCN